MEVRQQKSLIQILGGQQARYPLLSVIGLFIFLQLLSHDAAIYSSIELGESDANALNQLYFAQWDHEENRNIGAGLLLTMGILIVYAAIIRLAQRKV